MRSERSDKGGKHKKKLYELDEQHPRVQRALKQYGESGGKLPKNISFSEGDFLARLHKEKGAE